MKKSLVLFATLAGTQATAQESGWTYSATIYGWLPETSLSANTSEGRVESDISVSDALDTLKFGFMGAVEARHGRWGLIGDVIYSATEDSAADPAPGYSEADIGSTSAIGTAYLLYRVQETATTSVDLALGLRGFRLTTDISVTAVDGSTQSLDLEDEWIDALVGARLRHEFNDRWSASLIVDVGGFENHIGDAFQGLATVNYRINDRWWAEAGYRHIESDRGDEVGDIDLKLSGIVFGATYRF
ncbi:outer membrane protein [Rhodobacter sp. CZR27]|uniref:outer membrane protein n=1 Tax=Rhodobacter sp. CZR27 TaxID=2033869 RepID=UPI000BBE9DE2|nr:outer membrane beta-barrel protein [Rhodobacter sp. CZR27]